MITRLSSIRRSCACAPFLLALLLPVFVWAPLTYPGYFELHSGFLPVFNTAELAGRLADFGWRPLIGAPHDLLRSEGGLPYWPAALLDAIALQASSGVKLVFALSLVAASAGMFVWARRRWGAWPALVAASVYVFAPVVLATVFVRGALAEAAFAGLLPWVLAAAEAASDGKRAGAIWLAIGVAFSLWVQAGLALWLIAILLLYLLLTRATKGVDRPWSGPIALGAGVALGVLGLLPALLRHGTGGGTYVAFADHFVYLHQLLGGWGAGPSVPGPDDTLTFSLGLLAYGLVALEIFLPQPASGPLAPRSQIAFALGTAAVLLFLATDLSARVWQLIPFAEGSLTYPWQLLLLCAPWLAWLAGGGAAKVLALLDREEGENLQVPIVAAVLVLALLPAYADLRPAATGTQVTSAPLAIFGDNEIALLSVEPRGMLSRGGDVALEVKWQALRPLSKDYTVFFHIMGPDGKRYGQQDTMPQNGALPTSQWQPGQIVDDRYTAEIATGASPGPYEYWLGLYDLQNGQRLPTSDGDKHVLPAGEVQP